MSIQRIISTTTPVTVSPPNLPVPPNTYSGVYAVGANNILRLFFTQLCNALNLNILADAADVSGTATFNASTTVNVVFTPNQIQPNNTYSVALSGNAAGYCWVTNKLASGFTINCSASNSNSTDWLVNQ